MTHTVAVHESLEVAAPVARVWLGQGHAIHVKIGNHVVFGVASHIHNLWKDPPPPNKKHQNTDTVPQTLVMNLHLLCFSLNRIWSISCVIILMCKKIESKRRAETTNLTVLLTKGLWQKLHWKVSFNDSRGGFEVLSQINSYIKR